MSQLRLTGTGGGNTILNGNDTITTDQTFEFPDNGGTLVTGDKDSTGSGGSSGSAQVVGYQQGTWTPVASEGTISTITQSVWSRIGNTLYISVKMQGFSDRASAEDITITGIPYEQGPAGVSIGSCRLQSITGYTDGYVVPQISKTTIRFVISESSASNLYLQHSNIQTSGSHITFTITYLTDNTDWTPIIGAAVS